MADDKVIVTVGDEHIAQIDDVVVELRRNGLQVDQVHRIIGVITGSILGNNQRPLEKVVGVRSVKAQTTFRIASPEADLQ